MNVSTIVKWMKFFFIVKYVFNFNRFVQTDGTPSYVYLIFQKLKFHLVCVDQNVARMKLCKCLWPINKDWKEKLLSLWITTWTKKSFSQCKPVQFSCNQSPFWDPNHVWNEKLTFIRSIFFVCKTFSHANEDINRLTPNS